MDPARKFVNNLFTPKINGFPNILALESGFFFKTGWSSFTSLSFCDTGCDSIGACWEVFTRVWKIWLCVGFLHAPLSSVHTFYWSAAESTQLFRTFLEDHRITRYRSLKHFRWNTVNDKGERKWMASSLMWSSSPNEPLMLTNLQIHKHNSILYLSPNGKLLTNCEKAHRQLKFNHRF